MLLLRNVSREEIGEELFGDPVFPWLSASPPVRMETEEPHHALRPLLVDLKLERDSSKPVGGMLPEDRADPLFEFPVFRQLP